MKTNKMNLNLNDFENKEYSFIVEGSTFNVLINGNILNENYPKYSTVNLTYIYKNDKYYVYDKLNPELNVIALEDPQITVKVEGTRNEMVIIEGVSNDINLSYTPTAKIVYNKLFEF